MNDTITHFIFFFCLLFCDISCGPLWCVFPRIRLIFHTEVQSVKQKHSILFLLNCICYQMFVCFFRLFQYLSVFLCVDLKGRTIAQGKCRFCATSSAFALYHIVTVLKWIKKHQYHFPLEFLFESVCFVIVVTFCDLMGSIA